MQYIEEKRSFTDLNTVLMYPPGDSVKRQLVLNNLYVSDVSCLNKPVSVQQHPGRGLTCLLGCVNWSCEDLQLQALTFRRCCSFMEENYGVVK